MPGLLVRAGWALLGDPSVGQLERDVGILVRDGLIDQVGPWPALAERYPNQPREGGRHLMALPGLVNAHHHGRGVTWLQQGHRDEPLEEWLLGFRFAQVPDPELDARYAAERLLRCGTTTVMLSYYSPSSPALADEVRSTLAGLLSTGIRVVLAVGFLDRSAWNDQAIRFLVPPLLEQQLADRVGPPGLGAWPREAFDLFDALRVEVQLDPASRLIPALGPVAPQWCSDELLQEVAQRARATGAPVHLHALETAHQRRLSLSRTGRPQLARLEDMDFLNHQVSVAHALWLESADLDALARSRATVVHNPSSNMRLGSGWLALDTLRERGINVALGTDCAGLRDDDDLLQELGLAAIGQRRPGSRWLTAAEAVALATQGGARAAGLNGCTAALQPGMRADVLLIDLETLAAPAPVEWAAPLDLVVGKGTARNVQTVLVDGEVVVRDGHTTRTDGADTAARLTDLLRGLRPDAVDSQLVDALKSVVRRHVDQVRLAEEPM